MDDDKLLGNRLESIIAATRLNRLAKVVQNTTGIPCNCSQRKMRLNELHRKMRDAKASRERSIKKRLE